MFPGDSARSWSVSRHMVIKVLLRKRGQSALPVRDHMSPAKVTPNRQSARCVHSRILKQTHPHKITAGTPVIFHEDAHRLSSPQAFTAALRLSSLRLVCFAKYECLIHTPVTQHQDTLSPFMAATTRKGPALSGFRHATPRIVLRNNSTAPRRRLRTRRKSSIRAVPRPADHHRAVGACV